MVRRRTQDRTRMTATAKRGPSEEIWRTRLETRTRADRCWVLFSTHCFGGQGSRTKERDEDALGKCGGGAMDMTQPPKESGRSCVFSQEDRGMCTRRGLST